MFPLVEGQTLLGPNGRYRFLSRVAAGTFALIVRAWDCVQEQPVAVKCVLHEELNGIGDWEAQMLNAFNERDPLGHCAVVRLLDAFVEQGHVCLVVELLGEPVLKVSLWGAWRQSHLKGPAAPPLAAIAMRHKHHSHALLRQLAPVLNGSSFAGSEGVMQDQQQQATRAPHWELSKLRQMAVQLCAALAILHSQDLIHADLKPENILHTLPSASSSAGSAGSTASVRLVDFGNCINAELIALYHEVKAHEEISGSSTTGFDIQTLAYRAPEVAAGLVISPAMDMWSLGCVLMECASGQPLFTSVSDTSSNSSASSGAAATPSPNDHLLQQIKYMVNHGKALEISCAAYGSNTLPRVKRERRRSIDGANFVSLRHRFKAIAKLQGSKDATFRDFIQRLLDINPSTRLTSKQALLHPFVQSVFPFQLVFGLDPNVPIPSVPTRSQPVTPAPIARKRTESPKEAKTEEAVVPMKRSKVIHPERVEVFPATKRIVHSRVLRDALRLIPTRPKAEPNDANVNEKPMKTEEME